MERFVGRIWLGLAMFGATAYLVAVGATLIDVVSRFMGITLIHGTIDIVTIGMVLAGAMAVPLAEWENANIRVDPLSFWIPLRLRPILDRFWYAVSGVLSGLIAWRALSEALLVHGYGEVLPSLGISLGVLGLLVSVGFGIGAVAALYLCIRPRTPDTTP